MSMPEANLATAGLRGTAAPVRRRATSRRPTAIGGRSRRPADWSRTSLPASIRTCALPAVDRPSCRGSNRCAAALAMRRSGSRAAWISTSCCSGDLVQRHNRAREAAAAGPAQASLQVGPLADIAPDLRHPDQRQHDRRGLWQFFERDPRDAAGRRARNSADGRGLRDKKGGGDRVFRCVTSRRCGRRPLR